jgi:hypothetical protein
MGLRNECVYELFASVYYCYMSSLIRVITIWYNMMIEVFL